MWFDLCWHDSSKLNKKYLYISIRYEAFSSSKDFLQMVFPKYVITYKPSFVVWALFFRSVAQINEFHSHARLCYLLRYPLVSRRAWVSVLVKASCPKSLRCPIINFSLAERECAKQNLITAKSKCKFAQTPVSLKRHLQKYNFRTLLSVHHKGEDKTTKQAWSKWDFHYLWAHGTYHWATRYINLSILNRRIYNQELLTQQDSSSVSQRIIYLMRLNNCLLKAWRSSVKQYWNA